MPCKLYADRDVAMLGFGRSGRAVVDFLLPLGARITVYLPEAPPSEIRERYCPLGVRFAVGELPPRIPCELLVRSPVIRPDIAPIAASVAAGAELTSETELFLRHCPAPVIGVTGSDGKTTTASLSAQLLKGMGKRVWLGGNNGVPLLPRVWEMRTEDVVVLELSSFQLMTVEQAPQVAVITNITPNHLNWHTDMGEYVAAKERILSTRTAFLVTNADCAITREIAKTVGLPLGLFSSSGELPQGCDIGLTVRDDLLCVRQKNGETRHVLGDFHLPGRHNLENLMAAYAAVTVVLGRQPTLDVLADFRGVDHRLQYVDTVGGVRFYNSSIETSPTRTAAALSAMAGNPVVIAGGRGKGISLEPLADALARRASAVFLYGETGEVLQRALTGRVPVHRFAAFAAAFTAAAAWARPGDTVLLSPGCTAFDQFADFEARGRTFCALVAEWKASKMR